MRLPRPLAAAAAAAALVALAACGSGDAETDATDAGAAGGSFPVSIEHRYGTAEIPAEPKRVVTVGLMEQDALLAVGVVPVGTTEWFGEYPGAIWPWAQDELGDAAKPEVLQYTDGIQFERIAALKPDLILARYSGITQEDYDTLAKIAPTVAQTKGSTIDWTADWDEVALTVGKAVGREQQAQENVDEVRALLSKAATDNPEFKGKTGLVATPYEGQYVYGSQDPRGELLSTLGFSLPEGLDEVTGEEFGANLSKERTDLLDVDALVWLLDVHDTDKAKVESNSLYTNLDVFKNGGAFYVSGDRAKAYYGSTSFISVLSIPSLLENLVPQLKAAADGDPATKVVEVTEQG